MLSQLCHRLLDRRIELSTTSAARAHIAREGFDPVFGARPLKRYIQHELETRIARALIAEQAEEGDRIVVDVDETGLTLCTHKTTGQET